MTDGHRLTRAERRTSRTGLDSGMDALDLGGILGLMVWFAAGYDSRWWRTTLFAMAALTVAAGIVLVSTGWDIAVVIIAFVIAGAFAVLALTPGS